MVSKKRKKKKFLNFLNLGKTDMVLGKNVAIFDWEWGRNLVPRDEQKIPCINYKCTLMACISNNMSPDFRISLMRIHSINKF